MLLTEQEAKALTDKILSYVKGSDASANVSSDKYSHVRFAHNNFTTSGQRISRGANVTVWVDGKRGSSSTNDLEDASLKAMVEQAEKIAALAPVDREYMPTLGAQVYKPTPGYVEATANLSLTDRARTIGNILADFEKNKVLGAGFHQARAQAGGSATKNGNFNFDRTTGVSLSVSARNPEGTSSGYFLRSHYDISKLDTKRIAGEAIRKALAGNNAKAIDPGVYTVVMEPQAVADILGGLGFGFDARSAEEGRSPYSLPGGKTKLGQQIFDERSGFAVGAGRHSLAENLSGQKRCAGKSDLLAFLGETKRQGTDARPRQHDLRIERQTGHDGRNDRLYPARHPDHAILVYPQHRPAHGEFDGIDPRRPLDDRKR
jgi:predicted Zn-dependent protease